MKVGTAQEIVSLIRIVPEWNVKLSMSLVNVSSVTIRIVPEWNVKRLKRFCYGYGFD